MRVENTGPSSRVTDCSGSHGGSVRGDDRLEDVDDLETFQEDGRELFLSVNIF